MTTKTAIITLGTRDVQLDRRKLEESGSLLHSHNGKLFVKLHDLSFEVREAGPRQDQPAQEGKLTIVPAREGGKIILDHYDAFRQALCLPLMENLLEKMREEKGHWTLIFVYTDQSEDSPHRRNDTLYFKDIAQHYAREKLGEVTLASDQIAINENPADIDYQYQKFDHIFRSSAFQTYLKTSDEVWLLPQGGLDQVNQALTLQLILHARNRLRLFQQPEFQDLKEIRFAETFLSSINRQIILDKAKRFDFKGVLDFKDDIPRELNWLITVTDLAQQLLEGTFYDTAPSRNKILNILKCNLRLDAGTPAYALVENYLTWNKKARKQRPQDTLTLHSWYYLLRVALHNEAWEDALALLFRISEHALAHWMQQHYRGSDPPKLNFEDLRDEQLARDTQKENPKLLEVIEKISSPSAIQKLKCQGIFLNNPNYLLLAELFGHLRAELFDESYTEDLCRRVRNMNGLLNPQNTGQSTLRGLRNKMEHRLRRISQKEFWVACGNRDNLQALLETLEMLTGATGFSFFEAVSRTFQENLGPAEDKPSSISQP